MTREELKAIIIGKVKEHGFIAEDTTWSRWPYVHEADSHYLNFSIREEYDEDTDWVSREAVVYLRFTASLATMGGNPTPEELIRASNIIRQGAELVRELQKMGLSYIEKY